MVMVRVPVVALLLSLMVIVEVPGPGTDEGLKVMVVPLAPPDAVRLTALLNPPVPVMVTVTVPELFLGTLSDVGLALIENPVVELVTLSVTVVVSVVEPAVPVTVMV